MPPVVTQFIVIVQGKVVKCPILKVYTFCIRINWDTVEMSKIETV